MTSAWNWNLAKFFRYDGASGCGAGRTGPDHRRRIASCKRAYAAEGQIVSAEAPVHAQHLGVVAVPADRRVRGLIAPLGLGTNLMLQRLRQANRWGFLRWNRLFEESRQLMPPASDQV